MDIMAKHHLSLALQNVIEIKAAGFKVAQTQKEKLGLQCQFVGCKQDYEQEPYCGRNLGPSKSPANHPFNAYSEYALFLMEIRGDR